MAICYINYGDAYFRVWALGILIEHHAAGVSAASQLPRLPRYFSLAALRLPQKRRQQGTAVAQVAEQSQKGWLANQPQATPVISELELLPAISASQLPFR